MPFERTNEGRELRLASHGFARFLSAGFLLFWLCGWAVGETLVLFILVKGAIALLTGQPPEPGRAPLEAGAAVMIGAFLLFWLSLWTFGGVAAIAEFLRLVWGEDRVVVSSGRLTVIHTRGPFRSSRTFERGEIRSVELIGRAGRIALATARGRFEVSALGSPVERMNAAEDLRTELNLPDGEAHASGSLPSRWEEIITPEGERALVARRSTRRQQAWVATAFAMAVATLALVVGRSAVQHPGHAIPAVILLVFAGFAAAGAIWLARGRMEWRVGGGRLTLRRRYGAKVSDVFEARALRMEEQTDSDGDTFYVLYALRDPAAGDPTAAKQATWPTGPNAKATFSVSVRWTSGPPKGSKTVARLQDDASTVRDLAFWLSRAADIPLDDRSTPQAQALDLAALKAQLEQSGSLGKWASKVVTRLEVARPETSTGLGERGEPGRRSGT
jgi:hypothetical protein